uniref:Uncharacterized protein AlNc14C8G1103 n=1 Tax=Albugo laibachii Nc14 TaxID=890382 RepID=F0W230_9STRA|nr:conserved hypothetical protein [Albugo laibachii Nc14]|eukprot:CCA15109.1 conserved hypothetical protein [Albugo laibachii Nc14]
MSSERSEQVAAPTRSSQECSTQPESYTLQDSTNAHSCCICHEFVLAQQGSLPSCDHKFHFECIMTWSKITNLCPLCKQKFNHIYERDNAEVSVRIQEIEDCKQSYVPEVSSDELLATQLQLANDIRCEICGRGDDEGVLLVCEAEGCHQANHTYCIELAAIPESAWYCSQHQHVRGQRASDAIVRPAATVLARRRTRRFATLMSRFLQERGSDREQNFGVPRNRRRNQDSNRLAANYINRMSLELQQVQRRAERTRPLAGANLDRAVGPTRRVHPRRDSSRGDVSSTQPPREPLVGLSEVSLMEVVRRYRELENLMNDAVSSDNYASTVSLRIPKTARLRLISRVKAFFIALTAAEKRAVVKCGALSVLFSWIRTTTTDPNVARAENSHPQVLEGILSIMGTLPIEKEDFKQVTGLHRGMSDLADDANVNLSIRAKARELRDAYQSFHPPEIAVTTVTTFPIPCAPTITSTPEPSLPLPSIVRFSPSATPNAIKRIKTKRIVKDPSQSAAEYVKRKLYPYYKENNHKFSEDCYKRIVRKTTKTFISEVKSAKQNTESLIAYDGQLVQSAKMRLKKLLNRVYHDEMRSRAQT